MSLGAAVAGGLATYGKVMNVVNGVNAAKQVVDTTRQLNSQGNKYDAKLGNPGALIKKNTWEMPKYAEEVDGETADTSGMATGRGATDLPDTGPQFAGGDVFLRLIGSDGKSFAAFMGEVECITACTFDTQSLAENFAIERSDHRTIDRQFDIGAVGNHPGKSE